MQITKQPVIHPPSTINLTAHLPEGCATLMFTAHQLTNRQADAGSESDCVGNVCQWGLFYISLLKQKTIKHM